MNELDMTRPLENIQTLGQLWAILSDNVVEVSIVLIVILAVLALIGLIRVRWFYKREQSQLHLLENTLEVLEQQPIESIDKLKNDLFSKFGKKSNSLVYEQVKFVLKLAERGKLGRIQATTDMMPPDKLAPQQSPFANSVISVLLIIGLAGTLVAFMEILTSSGLTTALQANDFNIQDYTPAIEKIYSGLKSAMWASLSGIIGTVILLLVKYNLVQPIQERFFSHLNWVTEFYLIPICSQFEHNQVEQTLLHTTDKLAQAVNDIGNISTSIQSNVEHSSSLVQELNNYSENLVQKLNIFTEKTELVVDKFGQVTNEKSDFYQIASKLCNVVEYMGKNYSELYERIGELVIAHNKSVSKYEDYVEGLKITQAGFTTSQEKLVKKINEIPEGFEKNVDEYASILRDIRNWVEKFGELIINLRTQQVDYTANMKEATDNIANSLSGVSTATEQLDNFMINLNEGTKLLIPELTKLGIDPLLAKYLEELKNHLIDTQNESQEELNQHNSLKQIEESVDAMQVILEKRDKSLLSKIIEPFKRKVN